MENISKHATQIISKLIAFHKSKNTIATLTAIHPPERFGVLNISDDFVTEFHEKVSNPPSNCANGAIYLFENSFIDWLNKLSPKPKDFSNEEDPRISFSFSGIQNTSRAGTSHPIAYGEIVTGSVVISAGIDTNQVTA